MKNKALTAIALVVVVIILVGQSFFYVVPETQQVVVTQFGEFKRVVKDAGLKFKIPFIEKINRFDKRVLIWDGSPSQVPTREKRYIEVDTYARWQIEDPLKFFKTLRTQSRALKKLDDIVDSSVRDQISNNDLIETVRDSSREMIMKIDIEGERGDELVKVSKGRSVIEENIFEDSKKSVKDYGIKLIDVRIKRLNYVEQVRKKVYGRMREERLRVAEKYLSEGQGEMMKVRGEIENEKKKILSEAYRKSQEIKGAADAKAIKIYADAYSKDPEFYAFSRSLDSYEKSLTGSSTLILSTGSGYLKYLTDDANPVK